MTNILVVNVNWLGDVIFSTPIFKALKQRYPKARVTCLAVKRVKEILEQCPSVDEVIVYDDQNTHFTPLGKLSLIAQLRSRRFDAAFLLHRSMTRALMIYLTGIPVRVGFDTPKQRRYLTKAVALPPSESWIHRSDEYARLIEGLGIPVNDRACILAVNPDEERAVAQRLLQFGIHADDRLAIVNPGGNWDLKRWPAVAFATLVSRLKKQRGYKVLISGGPGDETLAQSIALNSAADPVVWAGTTSLKELLALFKRADVVISNDSGPSHIASSVGTDVIALFGPTRPEVTAPRGTGKITVLFKEIGCNQAPCYHLSCQNNHCMKAITVDDVLEALP